jgi:hypothetical protein
VSTYSAQSVEASDLVWKAADPDDGGYVFGRSDVAEAPEHSGFGLSGHGGYEESWSAAEPSVSPVSFRDTWAPADPDATHESYRDAWMDADEPMPTSADADRYAALRAAMLDVGQDFDSERPAEPETAYTVGIEPGVDGRAALQALLSEVTSAEEDESDIDGLADRGPWTDNELAAFEHSDWTAGTGYPAEERTEVHGAQGAENLQHDPAEGDPAAESPEQGADPAAEPINRGLLLKFLSSVRN